MTEAPSVAEPAPVRHGLDVKKLARSRQVQLHPSAQMPEMNGPAKNGSRKRSPNSLTASDPEAYHPGLNG
jgi:hypothetical protein